MNLRALRELQVDADRLIEATQSALRQDGDLLEAPVRATIEQQMKRLKTVVRESAGRGEPGAAPVARSVEDYRAELKEETGRLSRLTDPFAASRMDRAIQRALSGKTISELTADGEAAGADGGNKTGAGADRAILGR
jgi:molecular chaperone HscA